MISVYIGDTAIEVVETKKPLLTGSDKIISCSRKILSEKIIEEGKVTDEPGLIDALKTALKNAYPAEIKNGEVGAVIPDFNITVKRINFPAQTKPTTELILSEAKKYIPGDIAGYENYYKEVKSESGVQILYTAIPVDLILSYASIFKKTGLNLTFLSSTSFSLYALLQNSGILGSGVYYADIGEDIKLYLMDAIGPSGFWHKKVTGKTFVPDLKALLKKAVEESGFSGLRLLIGGEKSLEVNPQELTKALDTDTLKMGPVLDEIVSKEKINFDTGGVPSVYFDKVLGLINLSKMADVPNFAADLKSISKTGSVVPDPSQKPSLPMVVEEEKEEKPEPEEEKVREISEEIKDTPDEIKVKPSPLITDNIIEYKKSPWQSAFSSRFLILGLFLSIALILGGSFLVIGQSGSLKVPFISSPSLTPTPTQVPSVTPTPTVDPNLERTDVTLSVLNGTDKSGFARTAADELESLGYEDINVGNADKDDYPKTVIRIKDESRKYLPLIINDLKDKFDTSTVETLQEDSQYDAVIVLGAS